MSDRLTDTQRNLLLKGALYYIKSIYSKKRAYKYIALWMTLESKNGDDDLAYRIALTIPLCCSYLDEQERYVSLFNQFNAASLLNQVRTTLFIKASRSTQLGADVL